MVDALPHPIHKGRGATLNMASRFDAEATIAIDDGWGFEDPDLPPPRTTVTADASRSVIARNQSPDVPFDRSINPYRGCEHGCVYCFARPTHAYLGLSPGLDFETRLTAKFDAAQILARELRAPGYKCAVMGLGTNTDPYQPIERAHRITRAVLQVLHDFNHPVSIVTKGALVARDIDLLAPMAAKRLVSVHLSITTLDPDLARKLEPRASSPRRRLDAIRELAAAKIPVGVLAAPMIPALNDVELESILAAARDAGAESASYTLLRLPLEVKELMDGWLAEHAPNKRDRVLNLVRQSHGGKLYDSSYKSRFRGTGPHADLLRQRFKLALSKLGLNRRPWDFDTSLFKPPPRAGDQLSLL